MKFIDEINIYISSGNGGSGLISFSKIKSNKTTPDGGNGGTGGIVYMSGNKNYSTLDKLKTKFKYKAEDGLSGGNNYKSGKNGNDLYIDVPLGIVIYDNERKVCIGEILNHKEILLIAKGGKGGYGNNLFKKNIIKKITSGVPGEIKFLHLELHLLADIGLLGYPNAGKSLLLNNLTNAKSKVAPYIFTTLHPILGNLKFYNNKNIIIADIPGIIEKASYGKGLGFNFLKHLSKTKLLFHIVDTSKISNEKKLKKELITINKELKNFDDKVFLKDKWLIFNKIDLIENYKNININKKICLKFHYKNIFFISLRKKSCLKKLLFNIKEYFIKVM